MQGITIAGESLGDFGNRAASLVGNLTLVAGAATGLVTAVVGTADALNTAGEAAIRAQNGLAVLSGGHADEWMVKLRDATHGIVDDMSLAHAGALLLSSGLVKTSDEAARFAGIAGDLGVTFLGSTTQGIQSATNAMESFMMSGQTRGFKTLGVDVVALKERFVELQSEGLSKSAAAMQAFDDVAGPTAAKLGETGTAVERLKTQFEDLKQSVETGVAKTFEGSLNSIYDFGKKAAQFELDHPELFGLPTMNKGISDVGMIYLSPDFINREKGDMRANAAGSSGGGASGGFEQQEQALLSLREKGTQALASQANEQARLGREQQQSLNVEDQRNANLVKATEFLKEQADITQKLTSGAFNVSGGLSGPGMDATFGARITAMQKSGAGQGNIADEMKKQQQATDALALATGQATPQSLMARDAMLSLSNSYVTGKESAAAYEKQLIALKNAIAANTLTEQSAANIRTWGTTSDLSGAFGGTSQDGNMGMRGNRGTGGGGAQKNAVSIDTATAQAGLAALKGSVNEIGNAVPVLGTAFSVMGGTAAQASDRASGGIRAMNANILQLTANAIGLQKVFASLDVGGRGGGH